MKIGVCVLHMHGEIEDNFKKLNENGFDNCQLLSWSPDKYTEEEKAKILKAQDKYNIEITAFWCGWTGPNIWDFYDGHETLGILPPAYRFKRVNEILKGSDFAKSLGIKDIITHAGFIPENPHDINYHGLIASLKHIAQYAKKNDQYFNFETGQETPTTLLRAIQDIGENNLGVNLDPSNLILYGKANPCDSLYTIGKYVRGIHAKDGLYPTDGRLLGKEVPIGEGLVNFPELLKRLKELNYDGPITIEREIEGEQQTKDILTGREFLKNILLSL